MNIEEKIKERFSYSADSGLITLQIKVGSNAAGSEAGTVHSKGYRSIKIAGKRFFSHRVAWFLFYGYWPTDNIDHLNGQRSDNRIINLRDASEVINNQNRRLPQANNTTGFLGVGWNKSRQYFQAYISVAGKMKHLGYFKTADIAHEAYLKAKREMHQGCTI